MLTYESLLNLVINLTHTILIYLDTNAYYRTNKNSL